jgi:hypothetical protein
MVVRKSRNKSALAPVLRSTSPPSDGRRQARGQFLQNEFDFLE